MAMKSPTRRMVLAILLLGGVLALAVSFTLFRSASGNRLRVGYMRISPALPFFIAQDRGLFRKHEVAIEPVLYTSGLQMLDDLVNQRIDASITGPVDILFSRELDDGGRFRIYLHAAYSPASPIYSLVVKSDSPIQATADLRWKKIGVAPGTTNAALLALMLEKRHGLARANDYDIVAIAPGQQLDALRAGQCDALVPLEPTGTIAATSSDLRVVEWGLIEKEVMNPLPITAYALARNAVQGKGAEVKRFVAAMNEAVSAIGADPTGTRGFLVPSIGLTAEQAQRCGTGTFVTVEERSKANLQALADLLAREKVIKAPLDVEPLYYQP
jgi:ABC-type nitrate/sulfonate/bicarbonate transport system substrate-binding protein